MKAEAHFQFEVEGRECGYKLWILPHARRRARTLLGSLAVTPSLSQLVARATCSEIKRGIGEFGERGAEMRSVADGTRTVLVIDNVTFNVKMDERLFTPKGLETVQGTNRHE